MVFSERAQLILIPVLNPLAAQAQSHVVVLFGQPVPQSAPKSGPNAPVPALAQQIPLPIPALPPNIVLQPGLFTFAPNQHSEFRAIVQNIGNTPAYDFIFDCCMELISPPFNDFPKDARVARNEAPRTVYPKTPEQQQIMIKTDHPMSQMEYDEFGRGQRELWVRIRVYYRDAFRFRFRRRRFAEFGWRYRNVGMDVISKYQKSN